MLDPTCQDILQDDSKWKAVAAKTKNDWARCLAELQTLEDLIEADKVRRLRWAKMLRVGGFLLTIAQNLVAAAAAAVPLLRYDIPESVGYVLSGAAFVMSVSLWTRFGERSHLYLDVAKDSEKLSQMCKNIRKALKDIISDGRITAAERNMIRDMIGQMHRKSEEVNSMQLAMKLLGGGGTTQSPGSFVSIGLFKPSMTNYNSAFNGVNDIIEQIGNSQKEIVATAPHIIKEYQDVQLQSQMHSLGQPVQAGRQPGPAARAGIRPS